VTVTNAWRSEFKYDALGRRRVRTEKVWKNSQWVTASDTRYVYDHMLVIQERDALNLPPATYTRGLDLSGGLQRAGGIGGLLALPLHSSLPTPHLFFHADAGGNVTALTDARQTVVARYRYDPFGNLLGVSGPMAEANPYRFSSKEWHANSGLYYYGYRFYEPTLQRWLNRDPLGEAGGLNLHRFLQNSPLSWFDPWGLAESEDDPLGFLDLPELGDCPEHVTGMENDFAAGAALFNKCLDTTTSILAEVATAPLGGPGKGTVLRKAPCVKKPALSVLSRLRCFLKKLFGLGDDAAKAAPTPTRFINGVKVTDRATGNVLEGTVDLKPTLDRISSGQPFPHRNDGGIFQNRPLPGRTTPELPAQSPGYYREYVHPTPGVNGPGPQRIVVGQGGEMYYTPDH